MKREMNVREKSKIVIGKTTKIVREKSEVVWSRVRNSLQDDSGIGVVEMILILVVLIGLVLIFKSQLTSLVGDIFETITSESSSV